MVFPHFSRGIFTVEISISLLSTITSTLPHIYAKYGGEENQRQISRGGGKNRSSRNYIQTSSNYKMPRRIFEPTHGPDQTNHHRNVKFCSDSPHGLTRGRTEGIFDIRPLSRDMGQTPGGLGGGQKWPKMAKNGQIFFSIFQFFVFN